ncbi:MAG: transaldolase [Gammaproteobacteria bacterium]|nr:transaldolase [Gammaproteobacteria bacterium]MCW8959756.1 transaldolase [Gammaproteobacteria bacterium]MCW8974035.1 transaldolase [Gammaproteobacteria bacterium]MCW8993686.1 transaldolase [Gammaproteobacteria bacterium]
MNPLLKLKEQGQQVWLDNLSRTLLREGGLQRLISEDGLCGVTSNPAIFHKAIDGSPYYRDDLMRLQSSGLSAEERYEALVIADIREACDLLQPVYQQTKGEAGYVSLEVSPHLADDEEGSVQAARRLRATVARDNLLVKIPATAAGLGAIERLIAEGIRVNVTLMFSLVHYSAVAEAYIRGARRWIEAGGEPQQLRSVASLFLSRVDTLVDKRLEEAATPEALALRGKSALALARLAYAQYRERFHGAAFAPLARAGVAPQFPLWASTGTKNPDYSEVHYVEPLIGPETINTLPDKTLGAFRDHGQVVRTLDTEAAVAAARQQLEALAALGISLDETGEVLQREGVRLFVEPFDKLLALMDV